MPQIPSMKDSNSHRTPLHRLSRVGDFVASLPCFRLIRKRFPETEIRLLTNMPVEDRADPAAAVFGDAGFVGGAAISVRKVLAAARAMPLASPVGSVP
jgi:hypothetical protein